MRGIPSRLRDPVIADRSIDIMAAATWLCISGWGLSSALVGLPTVAMSTNSTYETIWGGIIGVLALVASGAAASTFLNSPSVVTRIRKKVVELVSVAVLTGFVAVYPALVMSLVIQGDLVRLSTFFLGASMVILPSWRARHLYLRIRKLREVTGPVGVQS